MKKFNYEEFQKRINEVNKAYRIFKPLTNNMTEAFRLYQEVLAEEKMDVFISSATRNRPLTPIDDYNRPKCPDCNVDLMLKLNVRDADNKIWNSAWFCQTCLTEYYSDKTAQDWMMELTKNV